MEKVSEIKPALILLDVQLGMQDGRQLCRQLKTHDAYKHISVILFSANQQNQQDLTKKYLCDGYIEKPFDISDFISRISQYITNN